MNTTTLILTGGGLALVAWVLHKLGQVLTKVIEALAIIAVVFGVAWIAAKALWKAGVWVARHWRSSLATLAVVAWCHWSGWASLVATVAVVAAGLGVWRLIDETSFDAWAGRELRSWWQRWTYYAWRMPKWLRSCRLTVPDTDQAVTVQLNLMRCTSLAPRVRPRRDQMPRIVGVRSGPSWDEVRIRLVAGQTPEDFDQAARALAVARGVARCQVRELEPNLVSVDFQRRNLLSQTVGCRQLEDLAASDRDAAQVAAAVSRVWSGRTEYGTDWNQSLAGGHTLYAGSTGAGKNSFTWCPLVSIAPLIRDRLVRVSAIDPKGMELAYGRGIFHRYAVTSKDAIALLDDLIEGMEARKAEHASKVRTVPITKKTPLELLEFDEIGALTRYIGDRKTRDAISDRIAVLTTQGRALGYTVRGYVQEPTKDTVPVRDLFPRRVCLRVAANADFRVGDSAQPHRLERHTSCDSRGLLTCGYARSAAQTFSTILLGYCCGPPSESHA